MCFHWFKWNWNKSGSLNTKTRLVKPVKHDLSSHSSVFTPVSPISKTEILSGKILPNTGYWYPDPVHPYCQPRFRTLFCGHWSKFGKCLYGWVWEASLIPLYKASKVFILWFLNTDKLVKKDNSAVPRIFNLLDCI